MRTRAINGGATAASKPAMERGRDRGPAADQVVKPGAARRALQPLSAAVIGALALYAGLAGAGGADFYQRSYELERAGKYVQALRALDGIKGAGQKQYVYHLRRGWLLHLNKRYPDAIVAYKRALALAPRSVEAHLGLTLPQMALRRWKDAASTAQAATRLDADNYLAASRLAFCYHSLGRYRAAEQLYRRMVALYPADIEMQVGLGWALLKQQQRAEAIKILSGVLAVAPKHVMARQGLGLAQ